MTTIKIKKGAGTPSGLTFGELAYDVTNRKLFIGITGGNALLANTDGGVSQVNGATGSVTTYAGTTGNIQFRYGSGVTANNYFGLTTGNFSEITDILTLSGPTADDWWFGDQEAMGLKIERRYNGLGMDEGGGVRIKTLGIGNDAGDLWSSSLLFETPTTNQPSSIYFNASGTLSFQVGKNDVVSNSTHIFYGGIQSGNASQENIFEGPITGVTATFTGLVSASKGISASGGVTLAGTLRGTTSSFTGLVSSTVGFSGSGTNITGVVTSFNNQTGAVTGVTVGGTNVFTALNSFNAGISAAGGVTLAGTFSGTTGSFSKLTTFNAGLSGDINISSTNASGNVMYLLMARGTGVTGVFIDNLTTPLVYNPFQGNLGLKGITLSSGSDSLSILPGSVTANNSTNNAYFYFIANGGNYFQSPTVSAIGDIGAVNSAMCLSVDPSLRTMTWGDAVYLTGVTSGFFGVNRNSYGMLSDYAVEINSPVGKGIQLMYNDYTGAVSNSVKMDVSSTGNYTVLPSGGLATITGTLNVSAGISAAGATFSAPITSTRMARHTSAAISAQKTADFTPTAAEDGTVFYINYAGKGSLTVTLDGLPIGWRAKFLNVGNGQVLFESTGDIYGYGASSGLLDHILEAICIDTDTYFVG